MSLETDIILSLLDIKLWMAHHSEISRLKIKKLKSEPYLNKSSSVNKKTI